MCTQSNPSKTVAEVHSENFLDTNRSTNRMMAPIYPRGTLIVGDIMKGNLADLRILAYARGR